MQILHLVVGNSGQTVARDVSVTMNPPLPQWCPSGEVEDAQRLTETLHSGLSSLPPGRVFEWSIGVPHEYFPNEGADPVPAIRIAVQAQTSNGSALPPLQYTIGLEDLKHQSAIPQGVGGLKAPMKRIADALEKMAKRGV